MREKVCAGLALAASYWRVPAAALGPQSDTAQTESQDGCPSLPEPPAEVRDRCERPDVRRPRRKRRR
jgi:hypothetical protein